MFLAIAINVTSFALTSCVGLLFAKYVDVRPARWGLYKLNPR
jgi:hypothetical protein